MKILLFIIIISMACCKPGVLTQRNIDAEPNLVFQTASTTVYKIKVDTAWYLVAEKRNGGIAIIPIK